MSKKSIVAPEDQSATFVELFFDIIFVFSVTQIVGLLAEDLNTTTIIESILIFWLIWWSWTQFTWALNAGDTTHHFIQISTLLATGIAFIMAIAIPESFGNSALLFSVAYILTRVLGTFIYFIEAWGNSSQLAAIRWFSLLSIPGLVAVFLGAILGDNYQFYFWAAAIILDINSATRGGAQEGWGLNMEHFSERHGLFVIIALGETLIVAASSASGISFKGEQFTIVILAVAITCAMWWSYFADRKPHIDQLFESIEPSPKQTKMARDVFSISHFPMIYGVILYALAIEEFIAHPSDDIGVEGSLVFAIGIFLFVGGMIIATWRACKEILWFRSFIILLIIVSVLMLSNLAPVYSLVAVLVGLLLLIILEDYFIHRSK
ncbi:MAG: low temperature requirement protein A [Candidatus Kariarchaeaceae archaeon]|jgi:low temperature requirement protein LtrA